MPLLWAFWMRSVLRGQQDVGFDNVATSFAFGLGVVAFVELVQSDVDAPAGIGGIAVPYVALGLIAIGLAHAGRTESEYGRSFGLTWLVAVGGTVLFIAAFALLFVLVDLDSASAALATGGEAIGGVIGTVLFYVLWPFTKLMEFFMEGVRWFMQSVFSGEQQEPAAQPGQPADTGESDGDGGGLPGWANTIIRVLIGVPLAGLILYVAYMLFTRFQRRRRPGEVKESAYLEGRLASDLSGVFGGLLSRLRPNLHLGRGPNEPIRRLYFEMLDAGERRGVQRHAADTPLELSPRLETVFAATTPSRITAAFDETRYGGHAPPPEEVRHLREEWETLQSR